jgi:PEP-CTERM motif
MGMSQVEKNMHRADSKWLRIALLAAATAGVASMARADVAITQFTPGDLVVLRGGDATNPDTVSSTNMVSLYLDEYTTSGSYVGTVDVPSSGPGALTLPSIGDFEHQGVLSLSTNGSLLSFAGYQDPAGSPDADAANGTNYAYSQPVIGAVGNSASSLSTTTTVNSYGPGSATPYIRGAVSNDGAEFWTFGKYPASGATSNGGLAYVSGGTTTTVEGFADWRDIVIANGQLYGGTGSSSVGNHAPYQISTGEPTTNLGNSLSNNTQLGSYPGGQSASAISLLDLPGDPSTQNGLNVLYTIGDQSTPGIVKYYFNGSTWVNQTNVGLNLTDVTNPTGLIASIDPSNPNWVDLTVSGSNGIYTYVDQSGYNGAIPANAFTLAATAPANEAFYGIAPVAVPEPASIGLIGVAAVGLMSRRRRNASR